MIAGGRVLAVIPARGGSKGVPGKNILRIAGRPLLQWTVDAARASRHVDRLVLSSDDDDIIAAATALGCEVPFRRAAALATDSATSVDVLVDALERLPGHEFVVLLQPTSPLRNASDIDTALELMVERRAPACVSLRAAGDHPYWTFRLEPSGTLTRFAEPPGGMPARRQDLPPAWCLNGAVYAARSEWFLREKRFLSEQTLGFQMPAERSLDIDTWDDVALFKAAVDPAH
jgi:CMP-N,N'-diacetyllegionaminic acid synthase